MPSLNEHAALVARDAHQLDLAHQAAIAEISDTFALVRDLNAYESVIEDAYSAAADAAIAGDFESAAMLMKRAHQTKDRSFEEADALIDSARPTLERIPTVMRAPADVLLDRAQRRQIEQTKPLDTTSLAALVP